MQPVLEVCAPEAFDLWPVAEVEPYRFLPLGGALVPAEVGAAVMAIAACNDIDPGDDRLPRPADPLESSCTACSPWTRSTRRAGCRSPTRSLAPPCCNGLEEWRDCLEVIDADGWASFGHDPSPIAERIGDTVRLTADAEADESLLIELPVAELRQLLEGAERDLTDFLHLAAAWTVRYLPDRALEVSGALARTLDLSISMVCIEP